MLDALEAPLSLLLASGTISCDDLLRARRLAAETGDVVVLTLTRLGLASEQDVAEALADALNLQIVNETDLQQATLPASGLTAAFLRRYHVLPLADGSKEFISIAMSNPTDEYAVQAVELATGRKVRRLIALPTNLDQMLDRLCPKETVASVEREAERSREIVGSRVSELERLREAASGAPVIRLVNQLFGRAVDERASDLHLEPTVDGLTVRLRVDGRLRCLTTLGSDVRDAVVSRVKLMANLDIAERRLPQDGRLGLAVRGTEVDFRIATLPTQHGESVGVRVLDRAQTRLSLSELGFDDVALAALQALLLLPNGLLLVTGPTGSGKTTTLYAALETLNTEDRKLMSVEDPVEYQLAGVQQVQVQHGIGLSFARILTSFLRHNPNVVMVGEIRDHETAKVTVQVALTGHLVLSTLHTNDAASGITRLIEMGIEDYLLVSTCKAILAQRLVRLLCTECREAYELDLDLAVRLRVGDLASAPQVYRAAGCKACKGSGFQGRTTILEILPLSECIRGLVLGRASASAIEQAAISEGMRTMHAHGMEKVVQGLTTVEEVLSAVGRTC